MGDRMHSPERKVCVWEGWARWIDERSSPEERLAAYETIMAIAFPKDEENPYQPPEVPNDGSHLSRADLTRRDVYNQWRGIIEHNSSRCPIGSDSPIRVELVTSGLSDTCGDKVVIGMESSDIDGSDSDSVVTDHEEVEVDSYGDSAVEQKPRRKSREAKRNGSLSIVERQEKERKEGDSNPLVSSAMSEFVQAHNPMARAMNLTKYDKAKIAEWNVKIPDAEALHRWIKENWAFPNGDVALSENFCSYAFNRLAKESNWCSSKTGKPFTTLHNVLHWLVIDYKQQVANLKSADKKIERELAQSEFDDKAAATGRMSPEELATLERRKRKAAEREAFARIKRGEVLGDA